MAIVKMKRVRLIALAKDRDALLSSLLHVGCVELREPAEYLADESYAALLHQEVSALADAKNGLTELQRALEVLGQYAPHKGSLFAQRARMRESELLDGKARAAALGKAEQINVHARAICHLNARETRVRADQAALAPWSACDIPLEVKGTALADFLLGTVPSTVDFNALAGALDEAAGAADVRELSADREQKYLEVLVHRSCRQEALDALRTFGFSFAQLKDLTGTAAANIRALDQELRQIAGEREKEIAAIQKMGSCRDELKTGMDRMEQVIATESAKERLLAGGAIIYLDGWASVPEIPALEQALSKFDCAYELTEPEAADYPEVPVELRNGKLVRPMNMVTDMYSLPAYGSVDPNPLMAPFFILFYGMMMADMGYGLIMMILSLVIMKKAKPNGATMRYMIPLMGLCGISTFIWGAMTGGFFGDFIPQLLRVINPASTFEMPALFTPLTDTIAILLGSLVLGCIQVFTGMLISVVRKIQAGDFIDALFDEITWWIILAGVALAVLGLGSVGGVPVLVVAGFLMLAVGGTRNAKGFGKLTSLVGLVYNGVSGFFSDILSYLRLMALMLAGSVIAQVFNTLGAVFGNVIVFVLISMVGNALNLALNLLGCYVHDLRLQCLEYFNRFYKGGGRPFKPLNIDTNYVQIMKEEQ